MKVKTIFLCDAATLHPDNTFSVLRGGIDRFTYVKGNDALLNITLVAIIELEISECGRLHSGEISVLDMDGGKLIPPLRFNFQTPVSNHKLKNNVMLNIILKNPKEGEHCIYINVDGIEVGSHPLHVFQKTE